MFSDNRARSNFALKTTLVGVGIAGLLMQSPLEVSAGGQKPPAPSKTIPAQNPPPKVEPKADLQGFGDVKIRRFKKGETGADFSSLHLTGPDTEIEVPDKASNSLLTVHADDIVLKKDGANFVGNIVLTGHLRYTLTQNSKLGPRKLDGTAGRGTYQRNTHLLELNQGVHATLTDEAHLSGPARLHTDSAKVDTTDSPYLYTLTGASADNDIQFTLRGAPDKQKRPTERGIAHVFGYQTGTFRVGETAHFTGGYTTVDFASPVDNSKTHIQARTVAVDFTPDGSELKHIDAQRDVRFHYTQPKPMSKVVQEVAGTAPHATYDTVAERQVAIYGPLDVDVTDPEQLETPGHIHGLAGDSLSLNLDKGNSIGFESPKQTMTFDFVPKQKPAAPAPVNPAPGAPKKAADAPIK